jgi:hypothetical protein
VELVNKIKLNIYGNKNSKRWGDHPQRHKDSTERTSTNSTRNGRFDLTKEIIGERFENNGLGETT